MIATQSHHGSRSVYSTFLGGAGEDGAQSVALDGAGNAYVAGYSTSSTFSVAGLHSIQPQSADAASSGFVAKIDATAQAGLRGCRATRH